jgi:hypothetical protein
MKTYTRRDEARRRLRDSIVRVGDEPVYITGVNALEPFRVREPRMGDSLPSGRTLLYIDDFADRAYPQRVYDLVNALGPNFDAEGEWNHETLLDIARENNEIMRREWREMQERQAREQSDADRNLSGLVASYIPVETGASQQRVPIEDLNLRPFKLGMVNHGHQAIYLKRLPRRRNYSQGITSGNTAGQVLTPAGPASYNIERLRLNGPSPALASAFKNQYPTLKEVLAEMAGNETIVSRAFSRDFAVALDRSIGLAYLYYKDKRIAHSEDGHTFRLSCSFEYLREGLDKKGVPLHAASE